LVRKERPDTSGGNLKTTRKSNGAIFCVWITFHDFPAFNKREIPVQFFLKDFLVCDAIGPVQMVTDREDNLSRLTVDTYNVDHGVSWREISFCARCTSQSERNPS